MYVVEERILNVVLKPTDILHWNMKTGLLKTLKTPLQDWLIQMCLCHLHVDVVLDW